MDYDKYGHCIICSKNMLIEAVIGGKVEKRLTSDYDETEVLLNNGSRMRVCTCRDCKKKVTPKTFKTIMQKVNNGWKMEVDKLDWDDARKQRHLNACDALDIVCHSEGKAPDILESELKKHKEKANGNSHKT